MGFDAAWLDLREPADRRARDASLLGRAMAHLGPGARVLDLGCGTGATARAFASMGAGALEWCFFDNDPALLAAARLRHPRAETRLGDLADLDGVPLGGVRMVTASALFDLVSEGWASGLVERLAAQGTALYAALSYDGTMRWSPEDRLDAEVTARFNDHQRGDKGFGPSLGPQAAARLAGLLRARGYAVSCAPSPWHLGPQDAALQAALLSGIAAASRETGLAGAGDWAMRRRGALGHARAEIGHIDILALPGGG